MSEPKVGEPIGTPTTVGARPGSNRIMRTASLSLAAVLVLATVASGGDLYRNRVDRGYAHRHSTGRYLSQQHIIGGRALSGDSYRRPYSGRHGYGSRYRGPARERIIIIERDVVRERGRRRW